jgi:hypothetical protein
VLYLSVAVVQISIDLAINIAANAAMLALAIGRMNTKIAVLQTQVGYLNAALKKRGTIPAELE